MPMATRGNSKMASVAAFVAWKPRSAAATGRRRRARSGARRSSKATAARAAAAATSGERRRASAAARRVVYVGMENAAGKMTFGQMSEIIFMVLMPLFFARLGVKKMLLVGMLAWVVRYALFALGNNDALVWMYYGGIILHGICYDFFFVSGQIYVDKKADADLRSSAQGFIALITYGVGILIGAQISGQVVQHYALADGTHEWAPVWLMAAVMAAVVAVLFAFFFKDQDGRPGRRESSRVA